MSGSYLLIAQTSTSAGFTPVDATSATVTLAPGNIYITDRAAGVTYTLPATATLGSIIAIVGKLGSWTVAQNANQQILLGTLSSTVGVNGSLSSSSTSDSVQLVCTTSGASTVWRVMNDQGSLTIV